MSIGRSTVCSASVGKKAEEAEKEEEADAAEEAEERGRGVVMLAVLVSIAEGGVSDEETLPTAATADAKGVSSSTSDGAVWADGVAWRGEEMGVR